MGKRTALMVWLLAALMLAGTIWLGYVGVQRERLRVPLLEAVGRQDAAEVQRLLNAGADPNAHDGVARHRSAWAAFLDSLPFLRRLRHPVSEIGPTALMIACAGERETPRQADPMQSDAFTERWKTPGVFSSGDNSRDDPGVARLLIDHGAQVNAKGEGGWTALMSAAVTGHSQTARLLLSRGAAVDARWNDQTPLMRAIYSDFPDARPCFQTTAAMLLNGGADVNAVCVVETPLNAAVDRGSLPLARLLLDRGANVNALPVHDGLHSVPLAAAVVQGNFPLAQLLLNRGADVDAGTLACFTPLTAASYYRHDKMLRFLLAHKANVNAPSADGNTALIWASLKGNDALVAFLLAHGADANIANQAGHTALTFALDTLIVQMLLRKGPSQKAKDAALAHMADLGNIQAARLLLAAGANPNTLDENGKTALDEAATARFYVTESTVSVMARLLLAHGANINLADREGKTPLIQGVYFTSLLRLLLMHGADVNAKDHEGRTALIEATANPMPNQGPLVHLLLAYGAKWQIQDNEGQTALSLAQAYASYHPAAKMALLEAQKKEKP